MKNFKKFALSRDEQKSVKGGIGGPVPPSFAGICTASTTCNGNPVMCWGASCSAIDGEGVRCDGKLTPC